jgi:hypothetical protein
MINEQISLFVFNYNGSPNTPEILSSIGLSKAEENIIISCFHKSYMKYSHNFDQMDYDLEERFNQELKNWRYVYSIYRNKEGASCGHHNGKFLKLKINDVIFKFWYIGEKEE